MSIEKTHSYPHLRQMQRVVWTKHCTLTAIARHIAAYLLNRMNEDYTGAFPSVDRICQDLSLSRASVIRHTKEIIDSRLFERAPGRKGMYTYRIRDLGKLVEAIDAKLEQYTIALWQDLTGITEQPVSESNRSLGDTGTGIREQPVPVSESNTERLKRKAQGKGPILPAQRGRQETIPPTVDQADPKKQDVSPGGGELQVHSRTSCKGDGGIRWVEPDRLPIGHAGAVWFDRVNGCLALTANPAGKAYYQALRDDFSIEVIQAGLSAAGAPAAKLGRKASGETLGALVRTYCGYALQKENDRQRSNSERLEAVGAGRHIEYKGGKFQP